MEFATGYASQHEWREKLYPLFEKVFGLDATLLADFYQRGFWDPTYTPVTFFDQGNAIANASFFVTPMMFDGKRMEAACIQSVMTDPAYRGQGLMKRLMAEMLKQIDAAHQWTFLFTSSPELYVPFGFEVVSHHRWKAANPYLSQGRKAETGLVRLSIFSESDAALIRACFDKQTALSHAFAPIDYRSSFFLNLYDPAWQQKLYDARELDAVLVFEVIEETLHLYAVIGHAQPSIERIVGLVEGKIEQVELHFCPDLFEAELAFTPLPIEKANKLMARGPHSLQQRQLAWPLIAEF
ncbi:GNAT family N-acetyltransferase [Brevibacillus fluminis]|uniref:GNAT family N-acetyltransferase n=1 Tax=Brevibacillus fluminis TaxID=511487 RepID=UPI003F89F1F0